MTFMEKAIRVLHLFNNYLPPSERWAYDLIRNVPEVEVHIAARRFLPNNYFDRDFFYVTTHQGSTQEIPLSPRFPLLKRAMKRIGRQFFEWGTVSDFQLLEAYVKEHKIQLVHAHFAPVAAYYLPFLEKSSLPLLVSFYGYDYEYLPLTKPRFVKHYQTLFERAAVILCEGAHGVKVLSEMGCSLKKLRVQPLGIDAPLSEVVKTKQAGELRLLHLASFTEKKGQLATLKAFAKAIGSCPNLRLTLVGDQRDEAYFNAVLAYLNKKAWSKRVTVLPWVDYNKLPAFLAQFDVLIQPSEYSKQRDCEGGAPVVLLKAQWEGLPIIATTHCDIPNVVDHDQTGILVPEGDYDELAAAICTFYEMEEQEYALWSQQARQLAEEKFDIKKNAKHLLGIYKECLGK